jgi:hypothetical protein
MALRAVVRLTLLRVLVLLSLARDAVLRLDFVLGIGISFGCAATLAAAQGPNLLRQASLDLPAIATGT